MSEVDTRLPPSRGRSSTRGGRAGYGRGGPRGGRKPANGATSEALQLEESLEEQGELGEMKKKYASELPMLKDMFPDWTDVDLVFALQESDGDLPSTVDKITQGSVSQFADVKKKTNKDRARSKLDDGTAAPSTDKPAFATRGGRGRGGFESTRGGRGRGTDRGRGGFRGGRGGHATTNGSATEAAPTSSIPTAESSAWDTPADTEPVEASWDTTAVEAPTTSTEGGESARGNVVTSESTPAAASEGMKSSLIPEGGSKKSWASMFAQPKPAPVAKKAPVPQAKPAEVVAPAAAPAVPEVSEPVEAAATEPEPLPSTEAVAAEPEEAKLSEPQTIETPEIKTDGPDLGPVPSREPLTEENVEHLPDDTENRPQGTQTAASTIGSTDPRNLTPMPVQQPPIGRPPIGGYATSAYRAAGVPGRSASYNRRVQEQQEAVVMPNHSAVDKAAVQFGSMGLNGEPGLDVDDDREEPETRQPPQTSPPSQPKASLPPAPNQMPASQDMGMPESLPTPKQAPGLPPASQQNQQQQLQELPGVSPQAQGMPQDQSQAQQMYAQYGRYGQVGMPHDTAVPQPQKHQYDAFSHQGQPSQYEQQYGMQSQQMPQQQQQQAQSGFGGMSSAPTDYSQYYTSDAQRNAAYQQYYGTYGQQDQRAQQQQQDTGMAQQRAASGFGAPSNESAFSSQAQPQVGKPFSFQQLTHCFNAQQRQRQGNELEDPFVDTAMARKDSHHPQLCLQPPGQSTSGFIHIKSASSDDSFTRQLTEITNNAQRAPPPYKLRRNEHLYRNISNPFHEQMSSRYGEGSGSGHNTPNPLMGGQQHSMQSSQHPSQLGMPQGQSQQQPQQAQQQQQGVYGSGAGYNAPYGHPAYSSPYQQAYQNQFGFNQAQQQQHQQQQMGGYGGYYGGKQGGMYGGGPQGYGMNSHSSFDQHASSPANAGAFGQNQTASMRSASGMGSGLGGSGGGGGLDDYGRQSVQGQQMPSHQSSAFGSGMNDPFARSTSGFGTQAGYGQQQGMSTTGSMAGQDDALKPFADVNKGGPSPALGQPGRPGSTANSGMGGQQAPQSQQQQQQGGFGGYGGFPSQGSQQYGGLGGLGSHQQGQHAGMGGAQGGYGGYGAGGFGQQYGGYSSRGGGWGASYGAH